MHSGVTGRYSVCRERNRFDPDDPVVARNLTEARKRPHPMVGRLPAFLSTPGSTFLASVRQLHGTGCSLLGCAILCRKNAVSGAQWR